MKDLKLTVELSLRDEDAADLAVVLGCTDQKDFESKVVGLARAATTEYIELFLGAAPLTTMTDLRERRLIRMIRDVFGGKMPRASTVAGLFGLTVSSAGTLLKNAAAKHRMTLGRPARAALKEAILNDPQELKGGARTVIISDAYIVQQLNDILKGSPVARTAVRLEGDSLTKYTIDKGSYDYLLEKLR